MVELKELEFMPRKFLIDGLIGPRPLAIASTKSNAGLSNLAGITSICVVSNQPPLLTISLSQDLDGRPRDTLTNLRENGKVTLHILPPTQEMAEITDVVSKPLPRDTSEWDSLTLSPVESPSGECWPPLLPKSVAAFECQVIEILDLPKGGVAKLCILEIERVIAAENIIDMAKSGSSIATLCQHRTLRIGPSPESWNYLCDIS
jgi:flavin reductase (DIM6/NTAB) family NADH-FMN oxidoreductase RutF